MRHEHEPEEIQQQSLTASYTFLSAEMCLIGAAGPCKLGVTSPPEVLFLEHRVDSDAIAHVV